MSLFCLNSKLTVFFSQHPEICQPLSGLCNGYWETCYCLLFPCRTSAFFQVAFKFCGCVWFCDAYWDWELLPLHVLPLLFCSVLFLPGGSSPRLLCFKILDCELGFEKALFRSINLLSVEMVSLQRCFAFSLDRSTRDVTRTGNFL